MKLKILIIYLLALVCYSVDSLGAELNHEPLPFNQWKEHQIVEAKNHVVRLSNRIHLLKTGRYKSEGLAKDNKETVLDGENDKEYQALKSAAKPNNLDEETLKQAEERVLKSAQERMKVALGNLQYAKELNIDDYLAVYLSRFKHDDQALQKVIGKFTDADLLEVIKSKISKESDSRPSSAAPSIISDLQPSDDLGKKGKNL